MAYFPPYIDSTGLHIPTYEDRLAALAESYRSIFGIESELSESAPDYQLLSVLARSLDDASALTLSAFRNMNPQCASGQVLDLLLPQYGLSRLPEETDDSVHSRIVTALAGNGCTMKENLEAEIWNVKSVGKVLVHVNDSDTTDEQGVPAHSVSCVVYAGKKADVAAAIFRKKAPGIGTYGSMSIDVADDNGITHTVNFYRPVTSFITFNIWVNPLEGLDDTILFAAANGLVEYIGQFDIAQQLLVPSAYGVCYAAAGDRANTFAITDLCATASAVGGTTRIRVPTPWNGSLKTALELIQFSLEGGQSGTWFTFNAQGERQYVPAT